MRDGAPKPDLNHPLRIEQSLLDGASKWCPMIVPAAEEAVIGIGMGIELNESNRAVLDDAAQDRQRDEVITANRQRHRATSANVGKVRRDRGQTVVDAEGVDRRVAAIRNPQEIERGHAGDVVDATHQARLVSSLAGTVAWAGPKGGAANEGYAEESDVDVPRHGKRQPHEPARPGKARHDA